MQPHGVRSSPRDCVRSQTCICTKRICTVFMWRLLPTANVCARAKSRCHVSAHASDMYRCRHTQTHTRESTMQTTMHLWSRRITGRSLLCFKSWNETMNYLVFQKQTGSVCLCHKLWHLLWYHLELSSAALTLLLWKVGKLTVCIYTCTARVNKSERDSLFGAVKAPLCGVLSGIIAALIYFIYFIFSILRWRKLFMINYMFLARRLK